MSSSSLVLFFIRFLISLCVASEWEFEARIRIFQVITTVPEVSGVVFKDFDPFLHGLVLFL